MSDCSSEISNNEFDRVFETPDEMEVETFFDNINQEFKYVQTHGGHWGKCNVCSWRFDDHQKFTIIKRCASAKCNDESQVNCPVRYRISQCKRNNVYYIDQLNNTVHLNKYPDNVDKFHGIHSYYLKEINRLYDEQKRSAKCLLNILIMNKNKGLYDERIRMPKHEQIRAIIHGAKKNQNTNELGPLQEYTENIKIETFDDYIQLKQNDAFSFACDVKTGSDENHCFMFFTSKQLLEGLLRIKDGSPTLFHLDCTYKVNNNRFPLIAFGQSDLSGQFHLICLAITSHETEKDFRKFYEALIKLCNLCGIMFEPTFIVQDACVASYNARTVFSHNNLQIIMCYFHVIKNVKENWPKELSDMILSDVRILHYSKNFYEFEVNKHKILTKWCSIPNMREFTIYFVKQWLNNQRFNNWMIFNSPTVLVLVRL